MRRPFVLCQHQHLLCWLPQAVRSRDRRGHLRLRLRLQQRIHVQVSQGMRFAGMRLSVCLFAWRSRWGHAGYRRHHRLSIAPPHAPTARGCSAQLTHVNALTPPPLHHQTRPHRMPVAAPKPERSRPGFVLRRTSDSDRGSCQVGRIAGIGGLFQYGPQMIQMGPTLPRIPCTRQGKAPFSPLCPLCPPAWPPALRPHPPPWSRAA